MKNKILSFLLGGILIISNVTFVVAGNPYKTVNNWLTTTEEGQQVVKKANEIVNQQNKSQSNTEPTCNGIKLNTDFPIIGNCITISDGQANPTNVFPGMMRALTRIIMSIILVVCFIMIIIAGIMWAGAGEDSTQKTKAKDIIKKVAITVLLLGFSGAILRLINPNFFG